MPIVNSEVWKVRNRGNGRLAIFEKHTDHNGDTHEHRYSAPTGHDTATSLSEWASQLGDTLIEQEEGQVKSAIQGGVDPAAIEIKHISQAQKAKQAIRALMLGKPFAMLKAANYIKRFTNAQIESHFTQAQRIRIRAMQNYVIDNQPVFSTDLREEI